MASSDAVFQNIRCFRSQDNAKHLLGEASHGVVVTDQCASYNWLDQRVTSFAWLMFNTIYKRWRNTLAVDKRPTLVVGSCCYSKSVFRTQHSYGLNSSLSHYWFRQMQRLRRSIRVLLTRGCEGTSPTLRRTLPAYSQV